METIRQPTSDRTGGSIPLWAAGQGRVLVTHDVSTLSKQAYERVAAGQPMPRVFEVATTLSLGRAIDDLLLVIECSFEDEWEGQVRYLPL